MNNPKTYLDGLFSHGVQALQSSDLVVADKTFRQILRDFPQHPDALHFLGLVQSKKGNQDKAIEFIVQAIERHSQNPVYYINLGRVYSTTMQYDMAVKNLESAIKLNPGLAEAHYNLGNVKKSQGEIQHSIASYKRTIELQPQHFQAWYNLGNNHLALGNFKSAIEYYEKALEIQPQFAAAHNNLGIVLQEWDRWQEAEDHFKQAIAIDPNYLESYENLAQLYSTQGKTREAQDQFRIIASKKPNDPWQEFKVETLCPVIPQSNAEIDSYRDRLNQVLDNFLERDLPGDIDHICKMGVEPSSNLIYQGRDDKPIKEKYARLFERFVPVMEPKAQNGGKKIGFVVTKGHEGVFIKCMRGMIAQIADQFDITVICSLPNGEKILRPTINHPKVTFMSIPDQLSIAAKVIQEGAFNVLSYWEVGTDAHNYFLPFFRLAPVQYTSWGWPITSGISNMDYFLSAEHLEVENSQDFYSEELVKFNRLPVYYYRPELPSSQLSRSHFGLPESGPIYLCAQNLRKVQPDFDQLVKGILDQDPAGYVVFIHDKQPNITSLLEQRHKGVLGDLVTRVTFLSRMPEADYLALLKLVDVVIDTLHYTGGANTTYDAFAVGTPIISMPTSFHRGRYTTAAYGQMGVMECIASSEYDYVEKVISLGADHNMRDQISENIRASSDKVFEDQPAVNELKTFLKRS